MPRSGMNLEPCMERIAILKKNKAKQKKKKTNNREKEKINKQKGTYFKEKKNPRHFNFGVFCDITVLR